MKVFFNKRKSKLLLLTLLTLAVGASPARAQKALPYNYGFENNDLAGEGWTTQSIASSTKVYSDAKMNGSYGFQFYYNSNPPQYLISPELTGTGDGVIVEFFYKNGSNYTETFNVGYSTTANDVVNSFTWLNSDISAPSSWTLYSNKFPSGTKYIAIKYTANDQFKMYLDDFSFSAPITGPALTVFNGETEISSNCNYDFGLVPAGATKTFTLSNPGTVAAPVSVSHTGSFDAALSATSIPAGGEVTLTVTMPDVTGSDVITISSTSDAIDDFVINVCGTIRDASKMWCNFSEGLPEGWTNSGNYTINTSGAGEGTSNGGYAGETSYSYKLLYSPLATFAEGEKLYLKVSGYGGTASWNSLTIRYSADGTNWTDAKAITNIAKGTWTEVEVTEIPAGNWYIGFYGRYVYFTDIYGGTESTAPVIALSQPSYDFGLISTSTTSEAITITNTGKSALTGLNITSDNANFTASVADNATTIAANGGTATFTVAMAPNATGAQTATITIKSDNADDLTFTVTGAVAKEGTQTAIFNDATLAGWTKAGNTSYSSDENAAYFYYSSNTLTSPKLTFAADDFLAVKAKMASSYGYVTVKGSADGTTFTEIKKLDSSVLNQTGYTTCIVSDIPTTYKYIQLDGYYCYVSEVAGLTYVPALSVTTGAPAVAVSTPASYDFGECKADATVTYNFANTGAGTINITNVAITGGGAAAYSTNWTASTTTPFALTITRAYDISRSAAQEAVVTVTTSDGDFVINVTGTDWAPITTFPWSEDFNSISSGIPNGWDNTEGTTTTDSYKWSSYTSGYDGKGLRFNSYNNNTGYTNFLKTPIMNLPAGKDMQLKFWYKNPAGGDFSVYISNDGGATYETALATGLTNVSSWTEMNIGIPSAFTDNVVIVFKGTSNYGNGDAYIYLDEVNVQEQEDGANFAISDNAKSTKDFGRVNPNSEQEETYTITNSGNEALEVNFTDATDFIVVKGTTEPWNDGKLIVPAKNGDTDGTASFTVKMVTDGTYGDKSGDVVLGFTALNATSHTISLKGTVIDPSILYVDFEDNAFPVGWQQGADWTIATASGNHYAVQSNTKTASALVTTPLNVADGQKLNFQVARNASGQYNVTSLKLRFSQDGGATWSDYTTYYDSNDTYFGSSFTTKSIDVPTGTILAEFFGSNIKLDMIEGLNNATKPALALTEGTAAVANGDTKDFGNLSTDGTATYTIKNIGSATLKADITGTGVTANPASVEIAAGETADITVTMAYAEPYGEKTGKITIDAEDDWIGDFVVNFTANLVDQTDFVQDFEQNSKPAGWYSDGNWTYADGVARIYTGLAKPMITEKVAAEADKNTLSFDAKIQAGGGDQTLSVYTSADRQTWSEAQTFTLTSEMQTFTLSALAAGEYYVKFEALNAQVDNLKGLKKVALPEHDLFVTATELPTDQHFVETEVTATATVASLIADETGVYAKLFVNNSEVATSETADIALNATATLTMSYTPTEIGTYTTHVVVYDGSDKVLFTSESSTFEVKDYPTLKLDETATEAPSFETGTYNVTVNHRFVAGWNTICLPFEVNVSDIAEGAEAYSFDAFDAETKELTFNRVTTLDATTPYVIYVPQAIEKLEFKKQALNTIYANAGSSIHGGVSFQGTYIAVGSDMLAGCYGLTASGKIMKASATATMNGLRGYFKGVPAGARATFVADGTQGIRTISIDTTAPEGTYDLQGRRVEQLSRGDLYIINGKKVVIR